MPTQRIAPTLPLREQRKANKNRKTNKHFNADADLHRAAMRLRRSHPPWPRCIPASTPGCNIPFTPG